MECCGSWDTSCCPFHQQNIVRFDNLKTKYSVNEDIRVEYTLHGHSLQVQQASTRDWLGIFPRGWKNLQQYLTFEYALVAPRAASSSNRTIIFPRVFHQEASTSIEYQLVYVSREIQVLATSAYFRFTRDDVKTTEAANHALQIPYATHSDQLINSGWSPPHIVLSDQSLLSLHPSKTIPANPRLSRACRSCGRPREDVCGLAAGRARFLAAHNNSLAERVVRLERDLALAEGTKCSLAERLKSYENFVAEMFRSLATKGVVKITDASGKEIILQQLSVVADGKDKYIEELENFGSKINDQPSNSEKNKQPGTEELSTNDRDLVSEHLSEEKLQILTKVDIEDDRTQYELNDDSNNDAVVKNKQTSTDVETQTREVDGESVGIISKTQVHENIIEGTICNDEYTEQVKIKESETFKASLNDCEQKEQKEVPEKGGWTDGETEKSNAILEDRRKSLLSKPSAIVIQGSNVKFAIIRY